MALISRVLKGPETRILQLLQIRMIGGARKEAPCKQKSKLNCKIPGQKKMSRSTADN
jgi:hypothetical protein